MGATHPVLEPFSLYVEGSLFGDQDILIDNGRNGRDSTAIAQTDVTLLVVTKVQIQKILKKFPRVRRLMMQMAQERKDAIQNAIKDCVQAYCTEHGVQEDKQ